MLRKTERITVPNLIGHSTTEEELVSDVTPLLRGGIVLEPVTISTTQHPERREGQAYLFVILSAFLIGEPVRVSLGSADVG